MGIRALGRLLDLSINAAPVDLTTAGTTGKRIAMRGCSGVVVVVALAAAASGTESVVGTLKQHTAASGGVSSNLATITDVFIKAAAALAGTETWTKVSQAASQTLTLADTFGTITGLAQKQAIVAFDVLADQLADGNTHISFDIADPGTVSRLASVLYIPHDLLVQRTPENLAASLS